MCPRYEYRSQRQGDVSHRQRRHAPFSWCCRRWLPAWWWGYRRDRRACRTSTLLSRRRRRTAWFLPTSTRHVWPRCEWDLKRSTGDFTDRTGHVSMQFQPQIVKSVQPTWIIVTTPNPERPSHRCTFPPARDLSVIVSFLSYLFATTQEPALIFYELPVMNLLVISRISWGSVAEMRTTWVAGGR